METIGIRALKSKLSEYIKRASCGEIIEITDRGRVVAQLRSPGPIPEEFPHARLLAAAAEGKVRLGRFPLPQDLYLPRPVRTAAGTAQRLLDADRAES